MFSRKWLQVSAVALCALGATPVLAAAELGAEVRTQTLKNGMKVIVWPMPDNPSVTLQFWFRVGGRNERPGITGLSHFFEHMMFQGSKKYANGAFNRIMLRSGGLNNGTTSQDVTVYSDWIPRSALEAVFDLEADRIGHLTIDPKVVQREREIVHSERRGRVDDNLEELLSEQVLAAAFLAHPYGFSLGGWHSDIEGWTQADLEQYFRTYYAPNNATLLVVGAVTPEEIFALARRQLEPIPAGPEPEPIRTVEPEQKGERRALVHTPTPTPLLQMAFHSSRAQDAETPAMELLVRILVEGNASRLYQRLVERERMAVSVSGSFDLGFDPGLTWVRLTLKPGGDVVRAEQVLDEELARVGTEGVTEAELRRAKNGMVAKFWRGLESNDGRADALGKYEVFHGDWKKLSGVPGRYEAVTREQVRQVAAQVLRRDNRTVGTLLPAAGTDEKQDGKEAAR